MENRELPENALEKGRQILEPLYHQYKNGESELYRSYFRYADDLLFEGFEQNGGFTMIGSGWALCPVCGLMVGWNREHTENKNPVGQRCGDYLKFAGNCNGILRSLTWDDMKPITKE